MSSESSHSSPSPVVQVYLSWPVPYCAEGCPPNWITDHYCDQACNNSMCDWDGGDCEGATRYGWRGGGQDTGHTWGESPSLLPSLPLLRYLPHMSTVSAARENCNTGCLNNWLGDRYCDQVGPHCLSLSLTPYLPYLQACRVSDCGYDAGDCGTGLWDTLYSVVPRQDHTHSIPLGVTAMFFNLSSYFFNGTISSAEHTPCPVIRTAVLAQTFKTLSLTFAKNTSRCTANVTINGTSSTGSVVTVSYLPHTLLPPSHPSPSLTPFSLSGSACHFLPPSSTSKFLPTPELQMTRCLTLTYPSHDGTSLNSTQHILTRFDHVTFM